jgi:hypothetical protein
VENKKHLAYECECRNALEGSDMEERAGVWKITLELLTLK